MHWDPSLLTVPFVELFHKPALNPIWHASVIQETAMKLHHILLLTIFPFATSAEKRNAAQGHLFQCWKKSFLRLCELPINLSAVIVGECRSSLNQTKCFSQQCFSDEYETWEGQLAGANQAHLLSSYTAGEDTPGEKDRDKPRQSHNLLGRGKRKTTGSCPFK